MNILQRLDLMRDNDALNVDNTLHLHDLAESLSRDTVLDMLSEDDPFLQSVALSIFGVWGNADNLPIVAEWLNDSNLGDVADVVYAQIEAANAPHQPVQLKLF